MVDLHSHALVGDLGCSLSSFSFKLIFRPSCWEYVLKFVVLSWMGWWVWKTWARSSSMAERVYCTTLVWSLLFVTSPSQCRCWTGEPTSHSFAFIWKLWLLNHTWGTIQMLVQNRLGVEDLGIAGSSSFIFLPQSFLPEHLYFSLYIWLYFLILTILSVSFLFIFFVANTADINRNNTSEAMWGFLSAYLWRVRFLWSSMRPHRLAVGRIAGTCGPVQSYFTEMVCVCGYVWWLGKSEIWSWKRRQEWWHGSLTARSRCSWLLIVCVCCFSRYYKCVCAGVSSIYNCGTLLLPETSKA